MTTTDFVKLHLVLQLWLNQSLCVSQHAAPFTSLFILFFLLQICLNSSDGLLTQTVDCISAKQGAALTLFFWFVCYFHDKCASNSRAPAAADVWCHNICDRTKKIKELKCRVPPAQPPPRPSPRRRHASSAAAQPRPNPLLATDHIVVCMDGCVWIPGAGINSAFVSARLRLPRPTLNFLVRRPVTVMTQSRATRRQRSAKTHN